MKLPQNRNYIRTVGLFLCPYRNLTTLTAATLSLHRNVQVMNHGWHRLVEANALEFLVRPSADTLMQFCRQLVHMSAGGQRGNYGGSITLSHAFDNGVTREAYETRFGDVAIKEDIHSLLWKESGALQAFLWSQSIDPMSLTRLLPPLRFISPIRNPLDHARSLRRYYADEIWGPVRYYLASTRLDEVFRYILRAHKSFFDLSQKAPDRFLYFFEHELGRDLVDRLAKFLDLDLDVNWADVAQKVMISKTRYGPEGVNLFEEILHTEYEGNRHFISHIENALIRPHAVP